MALKKWEALTADEKKMFIRQADVYAAYLAYTDHEIGRVIQAVEDIGKLDNTLIIYISGDNGSSAEGSPNGTPNEVAQFKGVEVPVAGAALGLISPPNLEGGGGTYRPSMVVAASGAPGTALFCSAAAGAAAATLARPIPK